MSENKMNEMVETHVGFEPLMPKIAEKFPQCGNELMTIDIEKVMKGE
jgi:hypothetical protein